MRHPCRSEIPPHFLSIYLSPSCRPPPPCPAPPSHFSFPSCSPICLASSRPEQAEPAASVPVQQRERGKSRTDVSYRRGLGVLSHSRMRNRLCLLSTHPWDFVWWELQALRCRRETRSCGCDDALPAVWLRYACLFVPAPICYAQHHESTRGQVVSLPLSKPKPCFCVSAILAFLVSRECHTYIHLSRSSGKPGCGGGLLTAVLSVWHTPPSLCLVMTQ